MFGSSNILISQIHSATHPCWLFFWVFHIHLIFPFALVLAYNRPTEIAFYLISELTSMDFKARKISLTKCLIWKIGTQEAHQIVSTQIKPGENQISWLPFSSSSYEIQLLVSHPVYVIHIADLI